METRAHAFVGPIPSSCLFDQEPAAGRTALNSPPIAFQTSFRARTVCPCRGRPPEACLTGISHLLSPAVSNGPLNIVAAIAPESLPTLDSWERSSVGVFCPRPDFLVSVYCSPTIYTNQINNPLVLGSPNSTTRMLIGKWPSRSSRRFARLKNATRCSACREARLKSSKTSCMDVKT